MAHYYTTHHHHHHHHASAISSVPAAATIIPAKRPTPNTTTLILRTTTTSTLILRTSSSSLFSPKPTTSSKTIFFSSSPFRVTPPHKYVYPDPIPEFAISETKKFRAELLKKLSKDRETFGGDLDNVINVCSEILSEFLHEEYGGPGTLLVEPFTDMLIALKEKNLPGAPLAARASLLWAQNYIDHDWEIWNSIGPK